MFLSGNYTGEPDELIFTMYPEHYVFENNSDYAMDVRLNTFMKRLYEQAKAGVFVTKSLKHKPVMVKEQDLFDYSRKRFKTDTELLDWMQERVREGHASGRVFDFYVKYTEKWLK